MADHFQELTMMSGDQRERAGIMSFRERRKQKNTKKIPTPVKSLLSREAKYAYLGRAGRQKYDSKYALNTR